MKKLFLLCLVLLPGWLCAQQKVEPGIFGGFANYQGDLTPKEIVISETKLSYGAFLRYHITKKFKVKGNVYLGFISGSDENDSSGSLRGRGWSFESSILEVSLMGEFHPLGRSRIGETGLFRKQLSPYITAGFGMVNTDPEVTVEKPEDEDLFPEAGFTATGLAFPLGVGLRLDLHEHFSVGFEGGWRLTLDDYLDGVKEFGNPDGKDLYMFFGMTISTFLGTVESYDF